MTQVCHEISSAQELQALVGCKVTSVTEANGDEGICINCEDESRKLVGFLITEEGSWHLYRGEENEKFVADFKEAGEEVKILEQRVKVLEKEVAELILARLEIMKNIRLINNTNLAESIVNQLGEVSRHQIF